jgi:hypothetical protein
MTVQDAPHERPALRHLVGTQWVAVGQYTAREGTGGTTAEQGTFTVALTKHSPAGHGVSWRQDLWVGTCGWHMPTVNAR